MSDAGEWCSLLDRAVSGSLLNLAVFPGHSTNEQTAHQLCFLEEVLMPLQFVFIPCSKKKTIIQNVETSCEEGFK